MNGGVTALQGSFGKQLDALVEDLRRGWTWASPECGLALHAFRAAGEAPPLDVGALVFSNSDRRRMTEAPMLATVGYVTSCGERIDDRLTEQWRDGIKRLSRRDPFPSDRQSFVYRPSELLGVALGLANDPTSEATLWLRTVLATAERRLIGCSFWQRLLAACAARTLSVAWQNSSADALSALTTDELALAAWVGIAYPAVAADMRIPSEEAEFALPRRAVTSWIQATDAARAAIQYLALRRAVVHLVETSAEDNNQYERDKSFVTMSPNMPSALTNSTPVALPDEVRKIVGNVEAARRLAVQLRTPVGVVPFVGAGVSVPFGMPGWTLFLLEQAERVGMKAKIRTLLASGNYEEAADEVEQHLTPFRFMVAIEEAFGDYKINGKTFDGALQYLPRLTKGPVLTTNFDRVLESAYISHGFPFSEVVIGAKADVGGRMLRQGQIGLIKLHGDWKERTERILTKAEYDMHYGFGDIDFSKPLPRLLQTVLLGKSLLFVGCSLNKDRTVTALGEVAKTSPEIVHHAVLEQAKSMNTQRAKERFLGEHNILPIWYPSGRHDLIVSILSTIIAEAENNRAITTSV